MQIFDKNIDELIPYENNPRKNDAAVDKVAESLKAFGWQQPIVIDRNNVIVAGHTRYKAAKKLGMEVVPVKYADELTEEKANAYRLADNKTSELSGWDFGLLDSEMEKIQDINMELFGFDQADDMEDLIDKYFEDQETESKAKKIHKCPNCGFEFEE